MKLFVCLLLAALSPSIVFANPATDLLPSAEAPAAPAFPVTSPERWLNSPPLTWGALRGKVVLVDFWTFDCWNCFRSFPWLTDLETRLAQEDLQVVGVHSPEFDHEKVTRSIVEKAREFGLTHPIVIDNDMHIWRAFENRYWPAYYLIDRQGRVRARFVGETHAGDAQATAIEAAIQTLLTEE
ncbi:MAG: redoxin domain-containing protein [Gammaproteobacteria bacterium]|nr:redoxin domain-containing protein [Gammaproteobacteria bacterium]